MRKALFLDRDGVVNVDHGYLYKAQQFEFIDGVFEACKAFQDAGFDIVIVTNQSGIGRGYYTEQDFQALTDWMIKQFEQSGISILDVQFCPHHPEKALPEYLQDCDCRKPAPGMLLKAINEFGIDPKMSIMVGDKASDMQAAENAGVGQKFLVETGKTVTDLASSSADKVFSNLKAIADELLDK